MNISIGNLTQAALTGINVKVSPSGTNPWKIPRLAPGEWKNETISLGTGNYRSLAAVASFMSDNRGDSIAEPVQMGELEKSWWTSAASSAVPVALGAFIGLLGGLLGSCVTSLFNLNKERLTAQLQWNRFLVENYDAPYRTFLTNCAGVVDAAALRSQFTHLDETALVPDRLRALITTGIQAVEDQADAAQKRLNRDAFLRQLRSQLLEPFARK